MSTETPDLSTKPPSVTTTALVAPPAKAAEAPLAQEVQPAGDDPSRARAGRRRRWLVWGLVGLVVLAAIAIAVWRLVWYRPAAQKPELQTVAVWPVVRTDLFNRVTYPAEFRAYQEVELHAKVSGYINAMNVDFGDLVKSNQVLATLEVPELLDQLHNAQAVEKKAEADYRAAHLNYTRLSAVQKEHPDLVAEQDLDTALAKDGMADAAIAAAKADVGRYNTLVGYTKITAPFDGVLTARYVDQGALIQSGTASETQSLPVFRVSDSYHLRLDFYPSVDFVKDIHLGDTIDVLVQSLGNKTFQGKTKRFSDRVSLATRTMMTELEVLNPTLEIVPGMYAKVILKLQPRPHVLTIPAQAVSGEDKSTAYVVNPNHEIEERPVTLGLETPDQYEVRSGLREGELVMMGSRTGVQPHQKVTPKLTEPLAFKE
ncbi:MAG TPA: efflux RND transporter periplasmic adaptor subunit [Dongiaceae bacterium]|nr:efflux RND transporter periplasmic adaptor subunit [Dongiaceae bacterium]